MPLYITFDNLGYGLDFNTSLVIAEPQPSLQQNELLVTHKLATMANPRIEEVDEDGIAADPDEMDLDSFDFARPQKGSLQPAMDPDSSQMSAEDIQEMLQPQNQSFSQNRQQRPQMSDKERERLAREQREKTKNYQCVYPVYFDASRSREDGRRVKKEDAVSNPLARNIVDALQSIGNEMQIGLNIVFEPHKCHPKDWANPGRVRVVVKEGGRAVSSKIKNSMSTCCA